MKTLSLDECSMVVGGEGIPPGTVNVGTVKVSGSAQRTKDLENAMGALCMQLDFSSISEFYGKSNVYAGLVILDVLAYKGGVLGSAAVGAATNFVDANALAEKLSSMVNSEFNALQDAWNALIEDADPQSDVCPPPTTDFGRALEQWIYEYNRDWGVPHPAPPGGDTNSENEIVN